MTRPEPAGAGTADAITRELGGTIHADDAEYHAHLRRLVDAAITAAESRAMERCAKIAEALIVRVNITGPHDDYAQGKKDAAAEIYQTILAIRSSIDPPGEEE